MQLKDKWTMWALTIICVMFLVACATNGVKSLDDMTHKERATWMMGVYNSQARDYKAMVARPDLADSQKEMLRQKKALLTQLWPMVNTYTTYVDSGVVPTREVEDQIIKIINDLAALALPAAEGG